MITVPGDGTRSLPPGLAASPVHSDRLTHPPRGHLRASHDDREGVIEALKVAFVHGRLSADELGIRVKQALVSRTYSDLAVLTADLPAAAAPAVRSSGSPLSADATAFSAQSGLAAQASRAINTRLAGLVAVALLLTAVLTASDAVLVVALAYLGLMALTGFAALVEASDSRRALRRLAGN